MAPVTAIVQCARHPEVETALRCSRCDTPICPKCLVQTPVGARCKDCARIVKSPVYTVNGAVLVRAAAASLIAGVAMGVAWALVLLPFAFSLGIYAVFLVGAALGFGFTRILELATGRKRGPVVFAFAAGGIVLAWGIMALTVPWSIAGSGILAVALGIYFAYQNLR